MDFSFLLDAVITGENTTYLGWILQGMMYTTVISVPAFGLALGLGILIGVLKTTDGMSARLATIYFEGIRSIPFMAQIFLLYFVVPPLFFPEWIKKINPDKFILITGILSLGIFMSGRIAAQVYGGIKALPPSQFLAATSLGFSKTQTYFYFLLPQTLRNILPTLTSEAMNTVKNSAVISTIGLMELSKQAQRIIDFTAKPYEVFICIVLGYAFINMIVLMIMKTIERLSQV